MTAQVENFLYRAIILQTRQPEETEIRFLIEDSPKDVSDTTQKEQDATEKTTQKEQDTTQKTTQKGLDTTQREY